PRIRAGATRRPCAGGAAPVRAARRRRMTGRLVVLTGPSGVGKGTVVAEVRRIRPDLWVSVSATTRPPREGEVDGVAYHFLTPEEFARVIAEGGFLEWAEFAGNRYGTPRAAVLDRLAAGETVLLEIELVGARQVRASVPGSLSVFLTPPSFAELEARLRGRGTDDDRAIQRRLDRARVEMAASTEFDVVVVNDDVVRAARRLLDLL
ncbi:MAG: guanylate kinase, partial [Candidatus Nanopelagicales bacterium]